LVGAIISGASTGFLGQLLGFEGVDEPSFIFEKLELHQTGQCKPKLDEVIPEIILHHNVELDLNRAKLCRNDWKGCILMPLVPFSLWKWSNTIRKLCRFPRNLTSREAEVHLGKEVCNGPIRTPHMNPKFIALHFHEPG
jgi:hypothetical protein